MANFLVEPTTCALTPERAESSGTVSFAFLKNSSPASGISEVSMSSSGIAAISASRFFEIGIEVYPFIPGRFARADDPCGAIPIRMDNAGYHAPTNETVAPRSDFAPVPFVCKCEHRTLEDRGGFLKADSMLALINEVLFLVPLEPAHVAVFSGEVACRTRLVLYGSFSRQWTSRCKARTAFPAARCRCGTGGRYRCAPAPHRCAHAPRANRRASSRGHKDRRSSPGNAPHAPTGCPRRSESGRPCSSL